MKLRSRHNSRNNRYKRVVQLTVIALAVLLVGVVLPSVLSVMGRVALYPFHAVSHWYNESTDSFPMFLRSQQELIDEIGTLENELAIAAGTDVTQKRLYEENMWLRQLLGVDERSRIAAAVIARPTDMPYDLLQIDRGEEDGVKVGAPVYIGIDNVIGVVSHTAPHYAFVELFTTPGFTATAFVSGADVMTTLEGYGSGVARIRVPQGIPLSVGNLVHIPSIEPGVFGRIEYLENRPSQPEQYGYVTLPKPVSGIHYVAVGTNPIERVDPPVIEERVKQLIREALVVDTSGFVIASSTATSSASSTASDPAATTTAP
ncbi:MAG TPA: rod shape-determining protein MreC [Candidatus Paceibacterota bacterium]